MVDEYYNGEEFLMNEKLNSICNYISKFLIIFVLGFYILSIIDKGALKNYAFVLGILFTGIFVFLAIVISTKITTERTSIITILGLSFALLFIWNFFIKAVPISDYKVLWEGANQIVDGTFSTRAMRKDDYFCFYNHQIAYAFYLSILIRLFHGSLAAIRIVEMVVMTITNVVLYKTLRLFTNRRTSFCGAVLFMGWPYLFMGSGILNSQHEAMLFEGMAVYVFLKHINEGKIMLRKWIICAMFLSIAVIMRPTAFVIVIALVLLPILKFFLNKNKQYLFCGGIILISYLIISNTINEIFILLGLAPYGIKSSNLWFKLSLGLTGNGITQQKTTDAQHTNLYYDLQYYGFDYDLYKQAAAAYIKRIIKSGAISFEAVLNRIVHFAGAVDNQYWFVGSNFYKSHPVIRNTLNVMGICIYFMSVFFAGIRCLIWNIMDRDEISLPVLIFLGYFIVYIVFETQTRYRYEQYYMLFLLAVPAMASVWRIFKRNAGKILNIIID